MIHRRSETGHERHCPQQAATSLLHREAPNGPEKNSPSWRFFCRKRGLVDPKYGTAGSSCREARMRFRFYRVEECKICESCGKGAERGEGTGLWKYCVGPWVLGCRFLLAGAWGPDFGLHGWCCRVISRHVTAGTAQLWGCLVGGSFRSLRSGDRHGGGGGRPVCGGTVLLL